MATEPATTRRGELPPELDDPLFRQALGQFDGALPTAGINPFVAEVLNQFLAHHVDRSVWTDRSPVGQGRRAFRSGFINVLYVPRDVQSRIRAPVVQWIEEGRLLIVRSEFEAWLRRTFEDPPMSAIYKGLKQHYTCTFENLTLCAYTPYTRSAEKVMVIPVAESSDLWPLLRVPPKPEEVTP